MRADMQRDSDRERERERERKRERERVSERSKGDVPRRSIFSVSPASTLVARVRRKAGMVSR